MRTKREKIKGMLASSNPGERAAAQAALERTDTVAPVPGSPDWQSAMIDHSRMVQECVAQITDPELTSDEVLTIRRFGKYLGRPWENGTEELRRIHKKLMA